MPRRRDAPCGRNTRQLSRPPSVPVKPHVSALTHSPHGSARIVCAYVTVEQCAKPAGDAAATRSSYLRASRGNPTRATPPRQRAQTGASSLLLSGGGGYAWRAFFIGFLAAEICCLARAAIVTGVMHRPAAHSRGRELSWRAWCRLMPVVLASVLCALGAMMASAASAAAGGATSPTGQPARPDQRPGSTWARPGTRRPATRPAGSSGGERELGRLRGDGTHGCRAPLQACRGKLGGADGQLYAGIQHLLRFLGRPGRARSPRASSNRPVPKPIATPTGGRITPRGTGSSRRAR